MKILIDKWRGGFLDYWRAPDEFRVRVHAWLTLEELDDLYFVRDLSLRTLWDYGREIGPRHVARKVLSRLSESDRNLKMCACGVGRLLEVPEGSSLEPGDAVAFFAPCLPPCAERITLPAELIAFWEGRAFDESSLLYQWEFPGGRFWKGFAGWQRESGIPLETGELMQRCLATLRATDWDEATPLGVELSPVREHTADPPPPSDGAIRSVAVFGWAHHVRTNVLPNLPDAFEITAVHELDAALLGPVLADEAAPILWDSAPQPRGGTRWDVVLASGYHATHAPVAAEALRRGASVISEKPLATTHEQLDALVAAMATDGARYFAAFQKRYSPMNALLRDDLGLTDDAARPISYHCVVHEVSLPRLHWYRWPSSGSRLLSNGCHWIDHFLFLNDFAPVASYAVAAGPGSELTCSLTLENGSFFTMAVGDRGSDRIGTREYVEISTDERTATIRDFAEYESYGARRLIRREKFHKLGNYGAMYAAIGRRILDDLPGDTVTSVTRTAQTVLALEGRLEAQAK